MYSETMLERSIALLRIAIGIVFFWFGALKVAGFNPVYEIVHASFPFLADGIGNVLLGGAETLIGVALLFNFFPKTAHVILVLHLLGTFTAFVTAPSIMFDPHVPMLTLAGEFVVKNLVLAMGGIVVMVYHTGRRSISNGVL